MDACLVFFGDPYNEGRVKRVLRKIFSPRLGYLGSAASTPNNKESPIRPGRDQSAPDANATSVDGTVPKRGLPRGKEQL
jgi:hypothetical protein